MIKLYPYFDLKLISRQIIKHPHLQVQIDKERQYIREHPHFHNGILRIGHNLNVDEQSVEIQDNVDYASARVYIRNELAHMLGIWGLLYTHDHKPIWGKRSETVRHPGTILWPIAGAVDTKETFYQALIREMHEETSLTENDTQQIIPVALYHDLSREIGYVYKIILKEGKFPHLTTENTAYYIGGNMSDHGPDIPHAQDAYDRLEKF